MSSGCLTGNKNQVCFGMFWFNTWRLSGLPNWRLGALVEAVLVHELLRQVAFTDENGRSSSTTPGTHNTLGSRPKSAFFKTKVATRRLSPKSKGSCAPRKVVGVRELFGQAVPSKSSFMMSKCKRPLFCVDLDPSRTAAFPMSPSLSKPGKVELPSSCCGPAARSDNHEGCSVLTRVGSCRAFYHARHVVPCA